uniref:Neuropeptide F n=1 Tax=Coptotermes formosanus TaxID=36987 RepID=R4V196_COPFO|nr:neuropeptide F [Coptotermes formosanus]
MQSSLCWLLVLGCALIIIPSIAPDVWAKPTDPEQLAAMADTLKYLQELDRYYSQIARPRFGKRAELSPATEQEAAPDDSSDRLWGHFASRR